MVIVESVWLLLVVAVGVVVHVLQGYAWFGKYAKGYIMEVLGRVMQEKLWS